MDRANDVQREAKGEGVLEEGDEVKKIRNKVTDKIKLYYLISLSIYIYIYLLQLFLFPC